MNGIIDMQDGSFNVGINVKVTKRDKKTGKILDERKGHNRCLKMMLMGITKWLNGEFNSTQSHLVHYDWIPRFIGLGTNIADELTPEGIGPVVNVNDTRLLNELNPRVALPQRNIIVNRNTQAYTQLLITSYLPEEYYNNELIAEAGLFSKASGNNCLFRITFDPILKTEDSVIEINWTISVISIDSTNQPYEELDKSDLKASMELLLNKFGELHPELIDACNVLKNKGIPIFASLKTNQTGIDEATKLINEEYAKL